MADEHARSAAPLVRVTLTPAALAAVQGAMAEDHAAGRPDPVLRIAVSPGGCSGFRYDLTLTADVAADDHVVVLGEEPASVRLAIDPFSAPYLEGVVIDYVSTLTASGFRFDNPNATGRCGCGSSFGT